MNKNIIKEVIKTKGKGRGRNKEWEEGERSENFSGTLNKDNKVIGG